MEGLGSGRLLSSKKPNERAKMQTGPLDQLLEKISHYGYPGLFLALVTGIVGLPVPDETLLVFSGYLISKGQMHIVLTWLAAFAGSSTGITVSYWIGRSAGYGFVHRYGKYIHLTEERLARVSRWFDRIGHWTLTIGYYIPGVRHFTALVAGMSGMRYSSFALFAYPGAILWVSTFLTIGVIMGDRWKDVLATLHREIVLAVLILAILGYLAWRFTAGRKKTDR